MAKILVKRPNKEEVDKLGLDSWGAWECEPSSFDWEYDSEEVAYVFEGKVKVKTEEEEVEINAGDLVTFPKGLKCTWNVIETIRKKYTFS